jgi:hypothetical protein
MALKDFGPCESARRKMPAFPISPELELLFKEKIAVSEIVPRRRLLLVFAVLTRSEVLSAQISGEHYNPGTEQESAFRYRLTSTANFDLL